MVIKNSIKTLFFIMVFVFSSNAPASDLDKEKRWASQIVDSLMVGEAEWLQVGNNKVLALFSEHTTEKATGAAIVLHGIGVHPNWDQIIRPVRSELPDHGWATLSVQLPVLKNEAQAKDYQPLFPEVKPRLDAAVNFLKKKGFNNIVIIAHSLGASMSAYYLADKPDPAIRGYIGIGISGRLYDGSNVDYLTSVEKITIPVLDIYGSNDLDSVLSTIKERAKGATKAGNKNYTQVEIPGANHFFDNKNAVLIKRIRGWIKTNAPGTEVKLN